MMGAFASSVCEDVEVECACCGDAAWARTCTEEAWCAKCATGACECDEWRLIWKYEFKRETA